jgi:hypothetical protein
MDLQRLNDEEIEQPGLVWVSLVEQELPTLPEHLSAPPVFCVVFVLLPIVLSVLRFTSSDYSFGIFKQYYSYIMTVSFIGEGYQRTWRKQVMLHKSLTNFIT